VARLRTWVVTVKGKFDGEIDQKSQRETGRLLRVYLGVQFYPQHPQQLTYFHAEEANKLGPPNRLGVHS
jgi:hypothetical protein